MARAAAGTLAAALLAGCASTVGKDFTFPRMDEFQLGATTAETVSTRYGDGATETVLKYDTPTNGCPFRPAPCDGLLQVTRTHTDLLLMRTKFLWLTILDDRLIGYCRS